MSVLEELIQKAISLQGESVLLEERSEYVHAVFRHKEGVSFQQVNLSIHNALEREMNRVKVKNDALITHIGGVPVQIVRIDQYRWVIRLFSQEPVTSINQFGLSRIHLKAIRLMESLPYGVRFVCSSNRRLASRLLASLLVDEVGRYKNKIVVIVNTQEGMKSCDDDCENVIHLNMDDDVFDRVRRIRPDVIFIEEPDTLDHKKFIRGVFELVLTGVQVWCSVTSNSVANMVYRISMSDISFDLLDMQVISGVIALKSVPKLCPHCAIEFDEKAVDMVAMRKQDHEQYQAFVRFGKAFGERLSEIRFHNPKGCEHCNYDGYNGDLILAEVLATDPMFFQEIRDGNLIKLKNHLEEQGFLDMHAFAKQKVLKGELDPFDAEEAVGLMVMDEILLDSKIMMDRELEHV